MPPPLLKREGENGHHQRSLPRDESKGNLVKKSMRGLPQPETVQREGEQQ